MFVSERSPGERILDFGMIRSIAIAARDADLSEVEIYNGPVSIKIRRDRNRNVATADEGVSDTLDVSPELSAEPLRNESVLSDKVGIVHIVKRNGGGDYAEPGKTLSEGTTIALIDVIGTFHEIKLTRSVEFEKYLVSDGDTVDYGAPIALVR
ncbi:hypothetical protein [Gluconobacter potus]|uniref:hypothetical protein n=1 Tax=Gluconobacter potus TaxID=2724927 RepID=UPI0039E73812